MSDPVSHHSTPHGVQGQSTAGGDMNLGKIVVIGFVSLVVFALGVLWAYQLLVSRERSIQAGGRAREPSQLGKAEIGIVDQVPFEIDHRLADWRTQHSRHLGSYGWIDRAKGIAHIPIEKAMQRVVESPPDIPGEGLVPVARPMAAPLAPAKRPGAKP